MNETSPKQAEANRENAKKGGVKTPEGKAVSKYNALKHGILKEVVSDYEREFCEHIAFRLEEQYQPVGILEKMLVDRIGVYYLKLHRIAKAENEFMQATLNPRRVVVKDMFPQMTEEVVENEGYTPAVGVDAMAKLSDTYQRYETTVENRMYKAMHELQRIQAAREGKEVPPPAAVDVSWDKQE